MKKYYIILLTILILSNNLNSQQYDSLKIYDKYKDVVQKIIYQAHADSSAWEQLAYMCDTYGPRLSGSDGLKNSLEFIYNQMIIDGLQNVKKEPVTVPKWLRNNEYCKMLEPRELNLHFTGLGRSIGTPKNGITAEVVVVKNFDELKQKADIIPGKIVLFNEEFQNYGQAVQYRWEGAFTAAKYGAVASLCRSVSPIGMQLPHTGSMMNYVDTVPKIPAGALSHEDADLIERMYNRGQKVILKLYMEAQMMDSVTSYNIMGELVGSEKPDEIIAIGGHSDSWDVGSGAQDDASGCFATWKALKVLKDLGLQPKRTIRAVMWVNEENGLRGGIEYANKHKFENHILMMEFDAGIFHEGSFGINSSDTIFTKTKSIEKVLNLIMPILVHKGAWGIDAQQLADMNNIPLMNFNTNDEGKYFWYHHSEADTPDKIDPKDMNNCIAAIAAMIYIYADLP